MTISPFSPVEARNLETFKDMYGRGFTVPEIKRLHYWRWAAQRDGLGPVRWTEAGLQRLARAVCGGAK
jgi:hypothetical protein